MAVKLEMSHGRSYSVSSLDQRNSRWLRYFMVEGCKGLTKMQVLGDLSLLGLGDALFA